MTTPTPEQQLAHMFVELAGGTVTEPSDPSGILAMLAAHSTRLLAARASSVLYVPDDRAPRQLASTDQELLHLEESAVEWGEGPGHDAHRSGRRVPDTPLDSDEAHRRWPQYAPRAVKLGHRRAAALPLPGRSAEQPVLGALILLRSDDTPFTAEVLTLGQSLTAVAGQVLAREREVSESRALADQLGQALTSRVIIEQAKGVLAARLSVPVDEAFRLLRGYARSHQRRLAEVAREVVHEDLKITG
ncbi:ANTAR domain-containing response regulator [Streptomyces minutiscleroticus]|uniref:ANTAR domain-containing response regulator n=1 Tax=Streptomyces minutiscleroticus TaxID=68238 RepID=UPI00331FA8F7